MDDNNLLRAYLFLILLFASFFIMYYVMSSLALFRIASKRKIPIPWLAWIPFAKSWTFGHIVDDFELQKGSRKMFRLILLVFDLAMFVSGIVLMFRDGIPFDQGGIIYFIISSFLAGINSLIGTMSCVLQIICLYLINNSVCPENTAKYLLIFFLVPLGFPICLLKISKKCEEKLSI